MKIEPRTEITTELKPCPFCGSEAELLIKCHIPSVSHKNEYTPRCRITSCAGRLGKVWLSREKAIEAWNRRAET